jgi:hypothetical protein
MRIVEELVAWIVMVASAIALVWLVGLIIGR